MLFILRITRNTHCVGKTLDTFILKQVVHTQLPWALKAYKKTKGIQLFWYANCVCLCVCVFKRACIISKIFLSIQFVFIIINKQYFNTVNITFIIDQITCQLLSQHASTFIHNFLTHLEGKNC
jgi:hypothetical protein